MDTDEKIIPRRADESGYARSSLHGDIDILFDGNKAPAHPQWRKKLLVHELARYCTDQR